MSMITRRFFIALASLGLVLAIGYSVMWVVVSQWVERGFRTWSQIQTQRGNTVDFGSIDVAGFPGPVTMTIPELRIASVAGGWQWSADQAVLKTRPWDWRRHEMQVVGTQNIAVPVAGVLRRFSVRPSTMRLTGEFDTRGRLTQGTLRAKDIHLYDAAGINLLSAHDLRGQTQLHAPAPVASDQTTIDLAIQATSVLLGAPFETPMGSRIQDISVVAAAKGVLPETFQRDAVDAWRRGGGRLELSHFLIDWGKLSVRGNGTASLDEGLRPLGAATADIKGYAATLAALERARVLRRKAAAGARLALDLLSRRDGGDNRRIVTVPVTAQNGALYLGPVRLLKLAPIPFPVRSD